ncbi:hypothetical protein ALQ72_03455 [Pseudomonas syringae pv. maculicola]|nr:hypothetical protein PLA106_11326 [Pseudomonas amygdali pv. lachrymans str. M302278]RMM80644.1 hypothetical protein ALQ72_03455 [Pseudomonas syringae pv. maculicola]
MDKKSLSERDTKSALTQHHRAQTFFALGIACVPYGLALRVQVVMLRDVNLSWQKGA